jgi:hypothetical protein
MAEINTSTEKSGKAGVRKSKKLSTKVDLTPMVDLGFLLITFFIITTKLAEAKAMRVIVPHENGESPVCESCALTIIPTKDDKIFYYLGELGEALEKGRFGLTNYSYDKGIGEIIRKRQASLERIGKLRNDLILIIKPTDDSAYRNLVDVLDEVLINDVTRYAITKISEEELKVLNSQKRGFN